MGSYTLKDFFRFNLDLTREVYRLAYPVVLGMISITAIGVADTMMVGRLNPEALAATGQAAILLWAAGWIMRSVEVAAQALISRRFGEGDYVRIGRVLDNAMIVGLALAFFWMTALGFGVPVLMGWLSTNETVTGYAISYVRIIVFSFPAAALIYVIRGFFSGIGKTRIYFWISMVLMTVNILANYLLIFGHAGFPRMEVRGAALGSMIAYIVAFLMVWLILLGVIGRNYRKQFSALNLNNLDQGIIREIIRLASPNAFRGVMVTGGLAVFYAMVDRLDVIQVAVVNVVLNIQSVSFMPGYGFGVAAATLIGQNLGAKNPQKAEQAGYESVKIGMMFMGLTGLSFILFPETMMALFTDNRRVIESGVFPLRIVGLVQVIDAAGMIFSAALEGAGNTRWVMIAETIVNWGLFLPLTWLLTFVAGLGQTGPWVAWAVYMIVFGIASFLKFRAGSWKNISI